VRISILCLVFFLPPGFPTIYRPKNEVIEKNAA
jgi:hypothetical protein